jgi:hypothetical protein
MRAEKSEDFQLNKVFFSKKAVVCRRILEFSGLYFIIWYADIQNELKLWLPVA